MTVRRPSRPRARRLAAALVPVLALLAACTGGDDDTPAASGQELKIGLLAPLKGPDAAAGLEARRGAQLAVDVINGLNPSIPLPLAADSGLPNLGKAKVALEVADTTAKPDTAQVVAGDAVNRLVSVAGVDALVGAYDPLVTEYASQRAERYEVPFVNGDSPATYLTDAGRDWFFRIGPTWRSAGEAFFSLLRGRPDAKPGKVLVLYAQDKAGQDVVTTVEELIKERSGTGESRFLPPVGFPTGSTDLQPVVDKVIAAQPDSVLLYVTPASVQSMIQAFTTRQYKPKVALSFSLGYVSAREVAPSAAALNGLLRTVSWAQEVAARNPAAQAVTQLYQRRFNAPMTEAAASSFTAVMTVAQAADAAGTTDNQRMRSALLNLDVPGEQTIMPWSGIRFDETHQNVLAQALVEQYTKQNFAVVHPRDATAANTELLYPANVPTG